MAATLAHDAPLEIVRQDPLVVAELYTQVLGLALPDYDFVALGQTDLTNPVPQERHLEAPEKKKAKARHTDVVVQFYKRIDHDTDPDWLEQQRKRWNKQWKGDFEKEVVKPGRLCQLAVIVESQTDPDEEKLSSWPEYVSGVRSKERCPTSLLVFCTKRRTEKWAAKPIRLAEFDPPSLLWPKVVGPGNMPLQTDWKLTTDAADDQEAARRKAALVVLSAFANTRHPKIADFFPTFLAALHTFDERHAELYYDVLWEGLTKAKRKQLEQGQEKTVDLRDYQPVSPYSKMIRASYTEGERAGEARGEANALLQVLEARRIAVDDQARQRITGCADIRVLVRWLRRAATATSVEQVFA